MSWPTSTIGEIAEFLRNGASIKQGESNKGLPITRIETIANRAVNLNKCGYANIEEDEHQDYRLAKGDILISHINSEKHLGKCAIYEQDERVIHGMNLLCLRTRKSKIFPKYLFYCLSSSQFLIQLPRITKKSVNQASFTITNFKELEIPLPPLSEQKRIAAILDKADNLRRKRQKAIKLADEFLRSVFLDMFGDSVTNPKGFPEGTIRDLAASVNYGTSSKADVTSGEFPILRMGNITYEGGWNLNELKYIDLEDKDKAKYFAVKGDLLFNRTNSKELVGKTAVFSEEKPMVFAGYLIRLRTNEKGNSQFISGYLNSLHGKITLQAMCKSIVGMANINAQELQDIKILIPPSELQDQYAELVSLVKQRLDVMDRWADAGDELFSSVSASVFLSGE